MSRVLALRRTKDGGRKYHIWVGTDFSAQCSSMKLSRADCLLEPPPEDYIPRKGDICDGCYQVLTRRSAKYLAAKMSITA